MRVSGAGEDRADYGQVEKLAAEIQERIGRLYVMGVSEYIIRQIVALPEPNLSRMVITEDFRIVLTDYGDMEIAMPTLSKVLYFFYLRHKEGMLFKHLCCHEEELRGIYHLLSPSEDVERMKKSIEDLVDSTKNSVNEKCGRVKAAFVSRFWEALPANTTLLAEAGKPRA